tara:strand:+ start:18462 stop:18836 length:375 start_codon:yes stop_codon:yes gene_type:complete
MPTKNYDTELLTAWEETYKKGQLSFWMLLSIHSQSRYVEEIQECIKELTNGYIDCEHQSIYRSLRKFHKLEIVDFELKPGHKGPDRKYYFLTKLGKKLLREFTARNINIFYDKKIKNLLKEITS